MVGLNFNNVSSLRMTSTILNILKRCFVLLKQSSKIYEKITVNSILCNLYFY